MNRDLYLFIAFICIVLFLSLFFIKVAKDNIPVVVSKITSTLNDTHEVKTKNEITVETEVNAGFSEVMDDILSLRDLLEKGEYLQLHEIIDGYQSQYEQGQGSEIVVDNAFSVIGTPNPMYKNLFDAWVTAMPDAYTAYLARATYYHRVGLAKRGEAFIKDTSEEQFAGMREAQVQARQDIDKALALNPKLTVAYSHLISIYATGGNTQQKFKTLKQALAVDPGSYIIRRDMLYYLLPRWGGSYAAIEEFLRDTEQHLTHNPDLVPLMGYLDYAKSWGTYSNNKFKKTIRHTTAALKKGKKSYYYKKRGAAYYSLKNYKSAIKDYSNAITLNKYNPDLYIWRAKAYQNLQQVDKAFQDFEVAVFLNPYDYSVRKHYAEALESNKQFAEAIDVYKIALYYNPNDEEVLFSIASIFVRNLKENKAAILPLERLIEIDSEEPRYWYAYITALYALRDCEVMGAIKTYIDLCEAQGDCFDAGLKWAQQNYQHLKQTYCKDEQ